VLTLAVPSVIEAQLLVLGAVTLIVTLLFMLTDPGLVPVRMNVTPPPVVGPMKLVVPPGLKLVLFK
jgi:hypothetical protein